MTETIKTVGLTKRYGRLEAVRDLDLTVPEGAIYALVGPNGAGKTTTIKILMNIFQASEGTAEVLGMESSKVAGKVFQEIGYVSENQEMPEWMRTGALLQYVRGFYRKWDAQLEGELVKQLNLPLGRKVRQLSRGMKMKLALASSMAYRPRLIVLDEPFGGLDPLVRDELIEALLERATEATIFISSHDLAEIETFASHVGYMSQGRLQFSEEMSGLAARFRDVEVTLEAAGAAPAELPKSWLQMENTGVVVRFVESEFDEQRTRERIRQIFGDTKDVTFRGMKLREIFLTTARREAET
jgi:ABC-type multidrug transport system ATPase subunit